MKSLLIVSPVFGAACRPSKQCFFLTFLAVDYADNVIVVVDVNGYFFSIISVGVLPVATRAAVAIIFVISFIVVATDTLAVQN